MSSASGWVWGVVVVVILGAVAFGCRSAPSVRAQPEPGPEAGIAAFWASWPEFRPRLEPFIGEPVPPELQQELSARVHAIHPDLVWETGGSRKEGQFMLALSGQGNFFLRKLAARWVAGAPAERHGWTYFPHRPGKLVSGDFSMRYRGHDFDLSKLAFRTEPETTRARLNVGVYHPLFRDAGTEIAAGVAFIALDMLLGEDDVERWIGAVEPLMDRPPGAVDREALVAQVLAVAPAPGAEPAYTMLSGELRGQPMLAMLTLGLKRLNYLSHEWHAEVSIGYSKVMENGLPPEEVLAEGHKLEEELLAAVSNTTAVTYGHLIHGGQLRVFFYAEAREPIESLVRTWASTHPERRITTDWAHDPEWKSFARF